MLNNEFTIPLGMGSDPSGNATCFLPIPLKETSGVVNLADRLPVWLPLFSRQQRCKFVFLFDQLSRDSLEYVSSLECGEFFPRSLRYDGTIDRFSSDLWVREMNFGELCACRWIDDASCGITSNIPPIYPWSWFEPNSVEFTLCTHRSEEPSGRSLLIDSCSV